MKNDFKNRFVNLIVPLIFFGAITGFFTSFTVLLYKVLATNAVSLSKGAYSFLKANRVYLPLAVVFLFALSYVLSFIYKKFPTLKGGGIPTSISALRGIVSFKWFVNLAGVFVLSLVSFVLGVPLGNEGPSVQMGTALGKGVVRASLKKHRAWERYSMTGGACAGFSAATGSSVSAIIFAIEEAHQRTSPMIIAVSAISVVFAGIGNSIFSKIFHVSPRLFESRSLPTLSLGEIWIPVLIGTAVGLFAVLFLKAYKYISSFFNKTLKKIPLYLKIFSVFTLVFICAFLSDNFVSSGHSLMISLFDASSSVLPLLIILAVRSLLVLCANTNGITGGIFLPLLVLGALVSSLVCETAVSLGLMSSQYFALAVTFGVTACIAAMMKMPTTAVVFALEVFGCYKNIIFVIVVCAVSYVITEAFGVKSINDTAVEERIKHVERHAHQLIEKSVTIQDGSFAVGKQIRDIFWPANLFVLSVTPSKDYDGKREVGVLCPGDELHVRVTTSDKEKTQSELCAIVGDFDTL